MDYLVGLDDFLDLVSDMRVVDTVVFAPQPDDAIVLDLHSGAEYHISVTMTKPDFNEAKKLLASVLMFVAKS